MKCATSFFFFKTMSSPSISSVFVSMCVSDDDEDDDEDHQHGTGNQYDVTLNG